MDPGAWAAYGQHYQRLGGGGVNPSGAPLGHQSQLNDLSLSAGLPRQDGIGGYGGSGPPLLLSHHGINVGQGSHHGDSAAASFVSSASLLSSGYDPMISATFQTSAKGHLPPLNVPPHGAGLYKAMSGKESEMGDLRVGFGRRGLSQAMASDPNMGMGGSPGIFNHQPAPPHSWRHSNMVPTPTSSPFGVLPHEAILPRSNTMEKLHSQDHRSKSSRMMMDPGRYMEPELSAHSYRNVLTAQGRSAASIIDHNPSSRGSIMVQQSTESLVGPTAESLGLSGLKTSDYSLYANSNVNARGLLPQNYMPQAHFPSAQELQNDKRDLYDLSLIGDKIDNYGGVVSNSKSHLDIFGSNSHSVAGSGGANSGSNVHPSVNQPTAPSGRSSHRSSGSSSSQSHNRSMCSSQPSQARATTHSSTYPTFSPTSTVANYSHSYQASPQPSPSHQQIHSPAHYSSPVAVDFTNTVPAHSAPPPPHPPSGNYSSASSVLSHNDGSPNVAYSSVITRATVPSSGSYVTTLMSNKVMSSKQQQQQQHLPPNEVSKHPTPTPSPLQPPPPPALVRPYEPVIRTPDISNNENCMGDMVPTNLTIPPAGVMSRGTPNSNPNSVNPNNSAGSSLPPLDHGLIHSPAMTPGPPPSAGRTSADNSSSCHSPIINKSMTMESVFNPQQMTLQDLAEMSSSNDKMDLEGGGPVGMMQHHKESLVNEEPNLMDLSQNPHHHHHQMGSNILGHMSSHHHHHHHLKMQEKKKKKTKKRKRHLQDEDGGCADGSDSPTSHQPPPPMIPLNLPPPPNVPQPQQPPTPSHVLVQPMTPTSMCPSPRVNQMYSSGPPSCSSRPPCMSPLVGVPSSPNYIGGGPNMYDRSQQSQSQPGSVESCRESGNGRFGQNGSIVEELSHHQHHVQEPDMQPASPPLASLFDPMPTSPHGNAEAVAFEEKLRNEASQIAKKKLDRRGPSIEDDLGFLADLPIECNVSCEKRKTDIGLKLGCQGTSNFIDSFLNFLKEGDASSNQSDGSASNSGKGQGRGRGRKKETYTTPPVGKKVELNPETGLFTCKQKAKNLQMREQDAQQVLALHQQQQQQQQEQKTKLMSPPRKGKFDQQDVQMKKMYGPSSTVGGGMMHQTNQSFAMNSDSSAAGMANQGFVDSVKMALQSLSDNEGYDAGVEEQSCNWNDYSQSDGSANTQCQWAAEQKLSQNTSTMTVNSSNNDCAMKSSSQRNSKDKWGKNKKDFMMTSVTSATGDSQQQKYQAESNQMNVLMGVEGGSGGGRSGESSSLDNGGESDSNDKEFYNFAVPRRESSMRKCKERLLQKQKEKHVKIERDNESSESESEKCQPSSDPAWMPQKSDQEFRPNQQGIGLVTHEMQWKQQQQSQLPPPPRPPGLRGRRKGRPPSNPNAAPRGRPPNKRLVSPELSHSEAAALQVKKPRGRGRPRLSDYVDSNEHHENVVKEGGFKRGEFLILISDKCRLDHPLWMVESHGVLKKFEPFKEQDRVLYRMTMFPSVKMESKSLYEPVPVSIIRNERNGLIVEYTRDRHRAGAGLLSPVSTSGNGGHSSSRNQVQEDLEAISQKDNFEVYLQTLISQVLDSNFISEIVKENDEYFLSHVHEIDRIVLRRKSQLAKKIPWNTAMKDCADHFPTVIVRPFTAEGGVKLMCQACAKECMSLWKIAFEGQLYDDVTLSPLRTFPVGKKLDEREFLLCSNCMDMVQAFSHMHHQKHNLYVMCANKVNSIRSADPTRESHVILEQCLHDSSWIQKLFCKIKSVWGACAMLCR